MSITRLARNTIWISFYAKNTKTSTDLASTTLQYWTLPWLERPSLEVGKGVEILAKPVANSWGSTYKFTRRRIIEEDNEKKKYLLPYFFIKRLFIVTYLLHKTILPNKFLVSKGWSLFSRCIIGKVQKGCPNFEIFGDTTLVGNSNDPPRKNQQTS